MLSYVKNEQATAPKTQPEFITMSPFDLQISFAFCSAGERLVYGKT
jgi:hypothetical protein